MKKTLHLVWNLGMNECVGFLDEADALYTATGDKSVLPHRYITPIIGDQFRETYGDDAEALPQTEVEVYIL